MNQNETQLTIPQLLEKITTMLVEALDQIPVVQSGISALACIQRGIHAEQQAPFDDGLDFTVIALKQELEKLYKIVDDCWFLCANPPLIYK